MNANTNSKEDCIKCISTISDLFTLYNDSDFIKNKMVHYITEQMPKTLETMKIDHEAKTKRRLFLEIEKEKFICKFLNEHKFFYISCTNNYVRYKNNNFIVVSEDNVQHEVLTKISSAKTLMEWKYKIKSEIMKEIKLTNFIKTPIPESETIQNIISNLSPTLFSSKEWVKYFLTIVGDNILKKNNTLIHFIDPSIKNILNLINDQVTKYFSTSINATESLKLKYHQHNYKDCRIVDVNKISVLNYKQIEQYIKNNFLNFIAVSVHYSVKHTNSDAFIKNNHKALSILQKRVFYLNHNSIDDITNSFMVKYIMITNMPNKTLCWNDILFMWKHYLDTLNLPNIIFHNDLKTIFENKLTYDNDKKVFLNCLSYFLNLIEEFKTFWNETILTNKPNDELEVEELEFLFYNWCKKEEHNDWMSKSSNFDVIDTIRYFYKTITILDDKYIQGVQSKQWNKTQVIRDFLINFKNKNAKEKNSKPIAFDNIYKEYCKCQNNHLVCSKQYFNKKIVTIIDVKHIDENIVLSSYWL